MPFGSTRSRGGSTTTRPTTGTGEGGTWKCECNPPLSAIRLQVKKQGKNRGRWFWTCPRPRAAQCDFFAWDDDDLAEQDNNSSPSAIVATIGQGTPPLPDLTPTPVRSRRLSNTSPSTNSNSLFGRLNRTASYVRLPRNTLIQNQARYRSDSDDGLFVDDDFYDNDDVDFADHTINQEEPITPPSLKRRRIKMENGDDGFVAIHQIPQGRSLSQSQISSRNQSVPSRNSGRANETPEDLLGELDSDDARRLATLTDSSQSQTTTQKISQLERQEAMFGPQPGLNPPSTPTQQQRSTTTLGAGGLVTPNTRNTGGGPSTTTGQRTTGYNSDISIGSSSQIRASSSPSRLNDNGDYEITAKVMALLAGQPIAESVRANVRNTLNNYALRARGVERGREMSRAALQARNARIGELQAHIANLQEEKRVSRERIRQLRSALQTLVEDDDDDDEVELT